MHFAQLPSSLVLLATVMLVMKHGKCAIPNASDHMKMGSKGSILAHWVSQQEFHIPETSFSFAATSVFMGGMHCSNISIHSVDATWRKNALYLSVANVSLHCTGSWRLTYPQVLYNTTGMIEVGISSASLALPLAFSVQTNAFPESVFIQEPPGCSASFAIDTLRPHNARLGAMLDSATRALSPFLREYLGQTLCAHLSRLINLKASPLLLRAKQDLEALLNTFTGPNLSLSANNDELQYSFHQVSAFFMRTALPSLLHPALVHPLLRSFAQDRSGFVMIPAQGLRLQQGYVAAYVKHGVHVRGLDSFRGLRVENCLNAPCLKLCGSFDGFEILLPVQVHISSNRKELKQHWNMSVKVEQVMVELNPSLNLHTNLLECFKSLKKCNDALSGFVEIKGADVNMTPTSIAVKPDCLADVELGIADAITSGCEVILHNCGKSVMDGIRRVLQSQRILNQLNAHVHLLVQSKLPRILKEFVPAICILTVVTAVVIQRCLFCVSLGIRHNTKSL